MRTHPWRSACAAAALAFSMAGALAHGPQARTAVSFVQFPSPDLAAASPTQATLTLKGKLTLPRRTPDDANGSRGRTWPAVVILHGSSGIDSRGDFYEAALNAAGIATLQIDMWEARGVTGLANRPPAPILTYPDAFSALAFLAAQPGIAPDRIGVLGFSWGGVVSLAAAERLYAGAFGGGRRFAAHVANYPVCHAANKTSIPALNPPAQKGSQILDLTGAPVLIQVGTRDDYDNGGGACRALVQTLNARNGPIVELNEYPGAFHGWDRLMVPVTAADPFADEGSFFATGVVPQVRIEPDVEQALRSRERVLHFFKRHL